MEFVFDQQTAYGLLEAEPHPVDGPPRAPELVGRATWSFTPLYLAPFGHNLQCKFCLLIVSPLIWGEQVVVGVGDGSPE